MMRSDFLDFWATALTFAVCQCFAVPVPDIEHKVEAMIRQATVEDVDVVRQIAVEAYEKFVPIIGKPPAPMFADFAAAQAAGNLWVCDEARIVGFVVFMRDVGSGFIENVAVAPDQQGRGTGRRLIEFAEKAVRRRGARTMELYTNARMEDNLSYYPKLGYEVVDRRREDGFDRVYFAKDLSEE